eukprot:COSAG06_NODE_50684_length_317_cov_0.637615_1_plen_95_part_10
MHGLTASHPISRPFHGQLRQQRQGPSAFVGVSWHKQNRQLGANITFDGKQQHLGYFDDELDAARAVDTAARRLRGDDAHGGRAGDRGKRRNVPSK